MTKRFFFQLLSIVKVTHQLWGFICPLTTFSFLGRIAWQWYLWNSLTKGKVWRPINNKSKQENKFYRRNFLYSHDSLLPMQVSVCPSVCLSVCPSANYSFISWQIFTFEISMDSSCKGKGFKTIWKQIHAQEKKLGQKRFFFNHLSLL